MGAQGGPPHSALGVTLRDSMKLASVLPLAALANRTVETNVGTRGGELRGPR